MTVGGRIKARRTELKMTQREFAARLGYTDHTTVTRIEAGKIDLPQSRIVKIAEVLGVTPAYLMGWEQDPEDLGELAARILKNKELLSLIRDFQTLDEADRATVSTLVASLAAKKKG